jgi:DNA-binding IclR family transcriptional regulator
LANYSGPNNRVIEIINFLAAHPTESFTLGELTERLSISHGSAHRVLKILTEARYLSRHPKHKTYSLGLALVAIGQSALEKHPAMDVARGEMSRLADELEVQCVVTAIVDDEMLFLAREGVSQTRGGLIAVGERHLFIPPLGLGYVAWGKQEDVESYLDKVPMKEELSAYLIDSLSLIRERGYSMVAKGPVLSGVRQIVSDYVDNYRDEAYWSKMQSLFEQLSKNEIQLLSLEGMSAVSLNHISAPVFAPSGEVALELSITGIRDNLSVEDAKRYAERLCVAAATVTRETHGRAPR